MLDAQQITAEAERRAALADPESADFLPNLEHLVAAINAEAKLSSAGEASTREALTARVAYRLEGLRWLQEYPEIVHETISEPVFLTGLPRSGTTFFQYLFDHDRRFRLIRTWEAVEPLPPPGFDPDSAERRRQKEAERRQAISKEFAAMHLADADGPEECHALLEQSCAAAGFHNLLDVPSYFDYLMSELDFTAAYRAHRRQLQLYQWHMPRPRWALKYPNHVLAMPQILQIYPDARFVMTHRDPVQTLASICKLSFTLRGYRSDEPVDPRRVGRQMLDFVERHIERILAFEDSPESGRVIHVDYYRLARDPVAVMPEIHRRLGLDTPEDVEQAMHDWYRRNPQGARGANPYALEDFGLDEGEVAERFAEYMRRFEVPRERDGLARGG